MNEKELNKSILSELAYFDIFEHPLTPMEVWRFVSVKEASLLDVIQALEQAVVDSVIGSKWGFYFLPGREHAVELRLRRYREAEDKYGKAVKYIRRLSKLPFIRMIGVCNSLAYSNSRLEGDIDFFIVTEPGRIWTARFYTAGYLKLMNERPEADNTRDKICLTFFLTPESFDLRSIKISEPDIYLAHWIKQVVPIYDPDGLYEKFLSANQWVNELFPHCYPNQPPPIRQVNKIMHRPVIQKIIEKIHQGRIGNWLEIKYQKIQENVLPPGLRELINKDSRVVLSDKMLKFHHNDRREQYQRAWLEKKSILIPR